MTNKEKENKLASLGDLAAVFLAGTANGSFGKLGSETMEPDCIVSDTLSIGRIERTLVFNFFAASLIVPQECDPKPLAEIKDKYQEDFKEKSKKRQCSIRKHLKSKTTVAL